MRIYILTFAMLSLGSVCCRAAVINVWLAGGQSNMVGAGHVDDLPVNFDDTIEEVHYAHDSGIVPAEGLGSLQPRLTSNNLIRRWYGSELTFGSELSKRNGEHAILKYARNGSPLVTQWAPDGNALLGFYNFADSQLSALRSAGYEPRVAGMIWVQGTGDASSLGVAQAYADNLEILVDGVRDRYESPHMQFLFSQAHADMDRPFVETLRARQQEYASRDPNSVLINIDDLGLKSDSVHYTSATQQELGFRFAIAAVPEPSSAAFLCCLAATITIGGSRKRKCLIQT